MNRWSIAAGTVDDIIAQFIFYSCDYCSQLDLYKYYE